MKNELELKLKLILKVKYYWLIIPPILLPNLKTWWRSVYSEITTKLPLFNGVFPGQPESRNQKGKPFWILMEQEMMEWPWHYLDHANHLNHAPVPHHSVFTDRMPFLPPNQQRQSTEEITCLEFGPLKIKIKRRNNGRICSSLSRQAGLAK